MAKNKFRDKPPPPPDHLIKVELNGIVKADNIKLYNALLEAIKILVT